MPVQINELVIKTTLEKEESENREKRKDPLQPGNGHIVDEMSVIEIVAEILKEKKER